MTKTAPSDDARAEVPLRITTHDLQIVKGSVTVLQSINFNLRSGEFAALVGPSGSGKTSLLRVLASLDPPSSGAITYCWTDGPNAEFRLYPSLSYIPQTISLWPHFTFRQNLLFATNQSFEVINRMHTLCDHLQLTPLLDRKPPKASQGQRQRFSLVRALLLEPIVLLCDEVTSALDEELAKTVWSILRDFVNRGGAVLASTHDGDLRSQCDSVYIIKHNSLMRTEFKK